MPIGLNAGNPLSEVQVTVQPDQTLEDGAAGDEFDAAALDSAKWEAFSSGRGNTSIIQKDGVLHMEVETATYDRSARIVSAYRLRGDFDIVLKYSGESGMASSNRLLFGVAADPQISTAGGYTAITRAKTDGWRWIAQDPTTDPLNFGWRLGAPAGNYKARRQQLHLRRRGNTFSYFYKTDDTSLGSTTVVLPQDVYVFVQTSNFLDTTSYVGTGVDLEDITVTTTNGGAVIGNAYSEVAGTARSWEYKNPLLPNAVTRAIEPSVYAGYQKSTTYDYDDPSADPQPSVPNSNPTKKLFRIIEDAFTDQDFNGTPEPVSRLTAYSYYGASAPDGLPGQLKSLNGPLANDTLTYRYDSLGQLEEVVNSLGQSVLYQAYGLYGQPTEIFDVNGVKTVLTYSRRGQVLSQSFQPTGLNLTATSSYEDNLLVQSVSPKGAVTVNSYDPYRRLQSTARRASPGGADIEKAQYGYNFEGLRTLEELRDSTSSVRYSSTSQQGKGQDPSDSQVREFVRVETPSGSGNWTTTWSDPGGRPVTRQDPSGHLTLYGYESRGRLASVTEKSVSDGLSGFVDHLTQYGYDDAGNLTSVTDPQGLPTTYKYDDLGRLLEVISPDSGTTRYGYDLAGRLTSKTQGVGTPDEKTAVYAYDALGRLLGVAYGTEGRDVDYFYDGVGEGAGSTIVCNGYSVPLPQSYAEGRLSAVSLILDSATNEKVVTTYEYDARGLVLYERKYVGSSVPHLTSYSYDADGNIESILYPRGLAVDYLYGGPLQDRVSAITADAGGGAFDIATSISYRPFGDVEALTYGNGRTLSLGADLAYRLSSVEVPGVLYRGYGRDSRGNINTVGFSTTSTDKTFSYDEVSRLTAAGGPFGSYTYRFDKNGNRLEVDEGSAAFYQYYAGTNRIISVSGGPTDLTYNGSGNLLQNGSKALQYGPDDRLRATIDTATSVGAISIHLPDGRRLEKLPQPAGAPVVYHHDLAGNLLCETYVTDPAGSGNPSIEYVYLGSHRLAAVTSQGLSGGYLPVIAQGPAGGSGPWYALLPLPREALRGLMWVLFGVSGISMYGALRRRRPHLAATAGGAALASVGAAVWLQLVPHALAIPVPANAFFFVNGHLGEPLALMNNAGSIVWLSEYKPYAGVSPSEPRSA